MALTIKQQNFCHKYMELGNASEAYRQSYGASKMKGSVIKVKASELLNNGNITVTLERLRKELKERSQITVEQKREWLRTVIERSLQEEPVLDCNGKPIGEYKFGASDAIRAINELNKMDGDHAAIKKDVSVNGNMTIAELLVIAADES